MSDTVFEADVLFKADMSGLYRTMNSAGSTIRSRMGMIGSAAGTAFSSAFTAGATAGLAALAGGGLFGRWAVNLASDAEEAGSKFAFVFGKAANETAKTLDEFAAAAGRSRFEMRGMAGDVGAILGPMGLSADQTGKMSAQLAILASDLASFFNATDKDAMLALQAGIIGEAEPLRKFGITLTAAKVEAEAFALGLIKSKDELTAAAKAQATLSIVMRETATAQGDAIRTSGSYANVWRSVSGAATDAGTAFGRVLLPAAAEFGKFLRGTISAIEAHSGKLEDWGKQLGQVASNVFTAVGMLRDQFYRFFGAGLNSLIETATGGWAKNFSEFVTKALDLSDVLTNDFGKTWEALKLGAILAFDLMLVNGLSTLHQLRAGFAGVAGGIGNLFAAAFDAVRAALETFGIDAAAIFSGIGNTIKDMIETAIDRFAWLSKIAGGSMAGIVLQTFDAYRNAEKESGVKGIADKTQKSFEAGRDALKNRKQNVDQAEKSRTLLESIGTTFATGFADSYGQAIKKTGDDLLSRTLRAAESARDNAAAAFGVKLGELNGARGARPAPAAPAASPSPQGGGLLAQGRGMLGGLLQGIGGGISGLAANAANLAGNAGAGLGAGMAGLGGGGPERKLKVEFAATEDFGRKLQMALQPGDKRNEQERIGAAQVDLLRTISELIGRLPAGFEAATSKISLGFA